MSGPTDIGSGEVVRVSFDLSPEDLDFVERLAAYRNLMAELQKKRLPRKWNRKSLAESLLAEAINEMRRRLSEMTTALGPLPPADDREAQEKYVRRVLAWDKRNNAE